MKKYSFKPGMVPTLGLIALLPLFISLGLWQLSRAEEKKTLMEQRQQRKNDAPLRSIGDLSPWENYRFRRVELAGEFDVDHQFLLDNQLFNQQAGYQVLTPLRIEGQDFAVLINRGWVPVGRDRSLRPDLGMARAKAHIAGIVDKFPGVGFKLNGAEVPSPGWPALVQLADAERLSERLGYRLLPYQVLLAPGEAEGYERNWRSASLNPEKNQGYALQWFSFALVLAGLYIWYGFKPKG
ncbi:MAG: SURF1 family protein [Methylococcaceae bacterium]|nr:SURF1 family protein [Methylococcaceae bacterium]